MFVPIRYTIYSWTPPELSSSQRIWLGGEVASVGHKTFVTAFKQRLSKSSPFTVDDVIADAKTLRDTGRSRRAPPQRSVGRLLVAALFFAGCLWIIVSNPRLLVTFLIVVAFVGPVSVGSLLWVHNKVDRWAQSLVTEQADSRRALMPEARTATDGQSTTVICEPPESEEVSRIRLLAEQGEATAQNDLALILIEGRGVPKDARAAVAWFQRAAEQDYATAQYNIGIAYARGHGVQRDEKLAVVWYRRAAEQG